MSKRNKYKNLGRQETSGIPDTKHKQAPHPRRLVNMPGFWEIVIGMALLLIGAGLSYFTGNPKILYIGALGVCVLVFYVTHRLVLHLGVAKQSEPKIAYFGALSPGTDPSLPLPPGVSADTVQLLLGDDLRVLSASSSNHIFSKGGKSFLTIGVRDGLMRITATIQDNNNQPICRIIDNEFQAFEERAFNPKQPDEHSLVVRDSEGNEALNLRFCNAKTIRITGRFQLPGMAGPVLILPDEGIRWPGGGVGHLTFDMTKSSGGVIGF